MAAGSSSSSSSKQFWFVAPIHIFHTLFFDFASFSLS
jgi:hypothetical protein